MSCLHRGPYIQRGRGLGSTLGSMFKGVIPAMQVMGRKILESPVTQKVLKTAKRSAIEAGLNLATDALEGENLNESLSKNMSTAKKVVTDSLISALKRSKRKIDPKPKPKPKQKLKIATPQKQNKRKKVARDIFDVKFN